MDWNDLRFVLALARHGSLTRAARALRVDHTTVGRRVARAEETLKVRLFTRSSQGVTLTADGVRLLAELEDVASSVQRVVRAADAGSEGVAGLVRVSAPETLGMTWLAEQLARLALEHPELTLEIDPTGTLANLGRGDAEVAVRTVRSTEERLVVTRVAEVRYGLYATPAYLAQHPEGLSEQRLLCAPLQASGPESRWLASLNLERPPAMVSEVSVTLAAAARAGGGVALLPRYLGDADPALQRIPRDDEPGETLWLTLHEDARAIPRVRVVSAFLRDAFERDRVRFTGG